MVKKKPAEQPHEEHADETWLIPYSDLLTLLLALFIVLFASSSLDKNKAAQIQYALAAAFGTLSPDQLNGTALSRCRLGRRRRHWFRCSGRYTGYYQLYSL